MELLAPNQDDPACPVTRCLSVIGGKWKPVILFMVQNGVNRFGAMGRAAPGLSKQMLTKQLRELEADGILHREIFPEIPPRVEYSLTDRGRSLLPVIAAMKAWGEQDL